MALRLPRDSGAFQPFPASRCCWLWARSVRFGVRRPIFAIRSYGSEWESARRQRVSSPKKIEVAVESPKVTLKDQNNAVVSFRQTYRSDNLNIKSSKTLVMVRSEGRWLIQQERAGG